MISRLSSILLLGVLLAAVAPRADAAGEASTWFLSAKRILVAPDLPHVDDGVVLIRGSRIVAVGKRGQVAMPENVRESTCSGGIVAAGFQNSHVHFLGAAFENASSQTAESLTRELTAMHSRYGYTTVVDTGSDRANTLALRARIAQGDVRGPRVLSVGYPLFPPAGIPIYLSGLPRALLDALPQPATPDDAQRAVRANLDAGMEGTKVFVATPQRYGVLKRMPVPVAKAAAEETHRRSGLVMAHPTDVEGVRTSLDAGIDILVHTTLGETQPWPESLVRDLVARRVSLIPTLKLLSYELAKDKVPEAVQQPLVAAALGQLRAFSRAGGVVLFGTDAGYMTDLDPTDEYVLMAESGLTPMQILDTLTVAPAARWNESGRRGRVVAGLDADLVVLDGDPALDVRNFAKVRCTFRGGEATYAK